MTTLAGYDWTWDESNRLTSMSIAGYSAENATFGYDDFGQLTGADRSGGSNDESYTYDDNGNRDVANGDTYTIGANNQIESDGTFDYLYDDEGNRTRKTEIATDDYVTYEWDYRNRLTAVSFYDDSDVLQKRVEYTYDVFDHWIAKQVDTDGDTDFDATEGFIYDGTQIVLRFGDDSAGPLAATDLTNRYLWGSAVDQLLADEQIHWGGSAYVTDQTLWPLGDHLNTNRDLVTYNAGTDTSTVANHISLDTFGNVTNETNSAIDEFFLFTGRARDQDTGLQYNWHRWLDTLIATWMSQDPIGFNGDDGNLQRYSFNSPTTLTDATGLDVWTRVGGAFQFALGVGEVSLGGTMLSGGLAATGTGVGAPPGLLTAAGGSILLAHGSDVLWTGWQTMWSGEQHQTQTSQALERLTGSHSAGEASNLAVPLIAVALPAAVPAICAELAIAAGVVAPRTIVRIGDLSGAEQRVLRQIWQGSHSVSALPWWLRQQLAGLYNNVAGSNPAGTAQAEFNRARAQFLLGLGPNPGVSVNDFAAQHGFPVAR